jgi:hypothetical protein
VIAEVDGGGRGRATNFAAFCDFFLGEAGSVATSAAAERRLLRTGEECPLPSCSMILLGTFGGASSPELEARCSIDVLVVRDRVTTISRVPMHVAR